jgi:hypothetical protein
MSAKKNMPPTGPTGINAANTSVTTPSTPPHATHGIQIDSNAVPAAPPRHSYGR